jgi:hypothetical protein
VGGHVHQRGHGRKPEGVRRDQQDLRGAAGEPDGVDGDERGDADAGEAGRADRRGEDRW